MTEYRILIPINGSKNSLDDESDFDRFRGKLRDIAGGETYAGKVRGTWKSDAGSVIWDVSRVLYVSIVKSKLKAFKSLLTDACKVFNQQKIYVCESGKSFFVDRPTDE
jgi:hypothetical protein